jgi:hypothetical protein
VKGRNVAVESARENATETGIAVSLSKGDDLGREREGGGVDRAHREEKREDAAKNGSEKSSTKTLIGVRVKRIERENGIETGTVNADAQNLERKIVNVSVREGKDVKENVVKGWNISRQMMEEKCELRKNPLMIIPNIRNTLQKHMTKQESNMKMKMNRNTNLTIQTGVVNMTTSTKKEKLIKIILCLN